MNTLSIEIMAEMVESRHDVIGFLHTSTISKLEDLSADLKVNGKSFKEIARNAFELKMKRKINISTLRDIITILCDNNASFRQSRYHIHYGTQEIFEWNSEKEAYVYIGTLRSLKKDLSYFENKYID